MSKQRSWRAYRTIDLALFAVMLILFEAVILLLARRISAGSSLAFTVSLAAPLTCIVYMRWGGFGLIHAVLSGLIFTLFSKPDAASDRPLPYFFAIYGIGNALSAAVLPLMKRLGKENVRKNVWYSLLCALVVIVAMQTGRAIMALILGNTLNSVFSIYTTDSLSVIFCLVIIWIARRLDGMFEDQKHYLVRVQREENEPGE